MLRIFVIVIVANAAMAQVPFLGTCPNLEAMKNFELDRVSIEIISHSCELFRMYRLYSMYRLF